MANGTGTAIVGLSCAFDVLPEQANPLPYYLIIFQEYFNSECFVQFQAVL